MAESKREERKQRGKPFQKGVDPRRHQFTAEERSRGFWTAMAVWGVSMGDKLHAAGKWNGYRKGGRA